MALVLADRVQETTNTTGTGTLTLAGAVSTFQSFSVIGNGNTTFYTITSGTDWEVGIGTYTSSGTTLSRDTVLSSSAAGAKITVAAGALVFCDYPASKATYKDASNLLTGYSISGGTIDNATVGATTPSTGKFTSLNATGAVTIQTTTNNQSYTTTGAGTITISSGTAGSVDNMNIGATTSGTGKFTSLECTSVTNTSSLARNSGQTANTTITNTTTYTTGGVTLPSQTATSTGTWVVRAFGQFTAANSATARTARVACFWGSTQLTAITTTVLTNTAQTTQWQCEFTLTGSSTTAIWTAGTFLNRTASSTALSIDNATSASTTVTAGAQTLDLRFSMSTAVAGDSWVIQSVTLQRLE